MKFRWSINNSQLTSNLSNGTTMWIVYVWRNHIKLWSCILDHFGEKLITKVGDDYEC